MLYTRGYTREYRISPKSNETCFIAPTRPTLIINQDKRPFTDDNRRVRFAHAIMIIRFQLLFNYHIVRHDDLCCVRGARGTPKSKIVRNNKPSVFTTQFDPIGIIRTIIRRREETDDLSACHLAWEDVLEKFQRKESIILYVRF